MLEARLQEAFGTHRRLFDVLPVSGTKVGVMTTTVSDAKLCILSNYNGVGERRVKRGERALGVRERSCSLLLGHRHLRLERSIDEPFTWEA